MKIAKWLARFMVNAIILLIFLYFAISLCVVLFKLPGQISEGQRMFFDLPTPAWSGLFKFQAICIAMISLGFFLRHKLKRYGENQ